MQQGAIERIAYRGRFAPTPSGPLHLGSLLTAVASYLQARKQQGRWLLRIDDLDSPRNVEGAAAQILEQLEAHALHWDETPRYQSQHIAEYRVALQRLRQRGLVYACRCTRTQLAQRSTAGPDDRVYAGTCRNLQLADEQHALRLRIAPGPMCFDDAAHGQVCRELATEVGDFVLLRADGLLAYQLACAVDEDAQGITEVVRGADLLGSTFRQLYVQQQLGLKPAQYRHLPVLVNSKGSKLSKQNHAAAITHAHAKRNLWQCLDLLGQHPPAGLAQAPPAIQLQWACEHWRVEAIPSAPTLRLE